MKQTNCTKNAFDIYLFDNVEIKMTVVHNPKSQSSCYLISLKKGVVGIIKTKFQPHAFQYVGNSEKLSLYHVT